MQVEKSEMVRNVTLAGHADTGKTTLASALLYTGGVANRMNRVEDKNTTTDFDDAEHERGYSIGLATCFVPWRKHKVNVIDTPGAGIFSVEAQAGVRVTDAVVLVVSAASGVQVMTEKIWEYAERFNLPVLVHLNKMDRENTDLATSMEAVTKLCGHTAVPIQLPIGQTHDLKGIVDLVSEKAYEFELDGDGKGKACGVPAEMADAVEEARTKLVEAVAESDDGLLEKFFEEGTLTSEELTQGLRKAILERKLFPVTVGSSGHGIGTSTFLDTVVDYLPNPLERGTFPATTLGGEGTEVETTADGPMRALVFKTLNDPFTGKISIFRVVSGTLDGDSMVWNTRAEENDKVGHILALQGKQGKEVARLVTGDIGGVAKLKHTSTGDTLCTRDAPVRLGWLRLRPPSISYAIEPKSKGDEDKISDALHRLMDEDLGLKSGRDPQTGEMLISGSGQLHVEITIAKLKSRHKVEVIRHPPKVPYRETVKKAADGHGRHKKQTGGRGQFADCKITIESLKTGEEYQFVDKIFGGSIPQGFRGAVDKGIQAAAARGYLAGYPVSNFKVTLLDGQYHDVDSSEMAFKIAGSLAFKDALSKAGPTILEPVMNVEITTTDEFMGDIMGDLSQRRGKPQGMDTKGEHQIIKATVPMAEMLDYAPALRSITQGRSSFTMELSHYEEVPRNIQEKIIAEAQRKKEEEAHH